MQHHISLLITDKFGEAGKLSQLLFVTFHMGTRNIFAVISDLLCAAHIAANVTQTAVLLSSNAQKADRIVNASNAVHDRDTKP